MNYLIKGFFLGIFFILAFTLILAPMLEGLIEQSTGVKCNYSCSINRLIEGYKSPLFLILFGAFWFLGSKIYHLSYLIQKKDELFRMPLGKKQKEFKWPWEHKLELVEDRE